MSNYLVPQIRQQMVRNNSALGWTTAPNGNWVPIALGAQYIPPQPNPRPYPMPGFGQAPTLATASGGLSGLSWLLIGAAVVYFRKPLMGFFAGAEQAAEAAVGRMRSKIDSRSAGGSSLTKRAGEARRKRSRKSSRRK